MAKIRRKQIDLTLSEGPTDGTYGTTNAAGLLNSDVLEDAFDKVSVILDALVPPNAPTLGSISENISGVTGKLSFGSGSTISGYDNHPTVAVKGLYSVSGNSQGIIAAGVNVTGTLADNVATNSAYPANSFSPGNQGTLKLLLDGSVIHSVDLATFTSGNSLNGNGSGFNNLSAATPVVFASGAQFPSFKYRTGTFTVNAAEWATAGYGYKTIQVVHTVNGSDNVTQTYNFVVDNFTSAISSSNATLTGLSMSGSKYLSGVQYHTSGTAVYGVTLSNVYQNTYSNSSSAITYTVTNGSITAHGIPDWTVSRTENLVLSNKTITIGNGSNRILGEGVTVNTITVDRTVQPDATNIGLIGGYSLLYDNVAASSTSTVESFDDERYRLNSAIESNKDVIVGYGSTPGTMPAAVDWDSTQSLVGGASSTHNTGLLVFNGRLSSPKVTNDAGTYITNGNFSGATDGPSGNPNYSTASGLRTYYRYFWLPSKANFVMKVNATGTFFVPASTTPSGNNLNIQILAPSQTTNGSGTTEWKDCVTAFTTEGAIGAYSASLGANVGNTTGSNWGLTIGYKTTAASGNVIILKITADSAWTGKITQVEIS